MDSKVQNINNYIFIENILFKISYVTFNKLCTYSFIYSLISIVNSTV